MGGNMEVKFAITYFGTQGAGDITWAKFAIVHIVVDASLVVV